ncbi:MAG: signal protein PDZ, partial [Chloroflexi bacterium]
ALKAHGKVRRGFLGIGAQPVELPESLKASTGLTQKRGLLLVSVEPNGPADAAGLTLGDILVSVNGEAVEGLEGLRGHLTSEHVGSTATLGFLRGGVAHNADAVIGEQP